MTYFHSTRSPDELVSLREALMAGLAPDGGLYLRATIPTIDPAEWRGADSFPQLAERVMARWVDGEISQETLSEIVHDALNFPVPLVALADEHGGTPTAWGSVHVLELFHGPTLSFKDFGARMMSRLMSHFLENENRDVTILVATSGDTGSAVADGFSGYPNIRVIVLYPRGLVSPAQERQLVAPRPGVTTLSVDGTFDDCQRMVKEAFQDPSLEEFGLSSANSINIGRLLPQMLHFMEAIRVGRLEEPVFCVPSGNLGNLTGGVFSHLAGSKARRFIAAHNANDFFPRHLIDGSDNFQSAVQTYSNAMDVGVPSNFERLRALLSPQEMRELIHGESVSDEDTLVSMRRIYDTTGYVADPHTAVGLEALRCYRARTGDDTPAVVLATAHPAKFPEVVQQALNFQPEIPESLAATNRADSSVRTIGTRVEELRKVISE